MLFRQFKSILYKVKYYAISFKLNFILSKDKFKITKDKIKGKYITQDEDVILSMRCRPCVYYNKFILFKFTIVTKHYKEYYEYGRCHRDNKPAYIEYENNKIVVEQYYVNGKLHRHNQPAIIQYYSNGNVQRKGYYINNMRHRIDKPADIWYYKDGNVKTEYYYKNNRLYHHNGYSIIEYNRDRSVKNRYY